jgi:hypothetical protein
MAAEGMITRLPTMNAWDAPILAPRLAQLLAGRLGNAKDRLKRRPQKRPWRPPWSLRLLRHRILATMVRTAATKTRAAFATRTATSPVLPVRDGFATVSKGTSALQDAIQHTTVIRAEYLRRPRRRQRKRRPLSQRFRRTLHGQVVAVQAQVGRRIGLLISVARRSRW